MDTQLKLIGKGATAEVFQWEEGIILKLFYSFISKETCNLEYESSRLISSHFSFLPKAYEIIERDNRCGIIYEKVSGPTLMAALLHNLKACKSYSKRLALIQTGYQKEITFSIIHSFVPGVSPGLQTILKFFKRRIYSSYIKEYQRQTGCTLKDIQMWELPIAAARLAEERPSEEEARLLKLVRKQLLIKGSV